MGKLNFPKTTSVVIKTTFVVVEDVLGTEKPAFRDTVLGSRGNKVTFFCIKRQNFCLKYLGCT